MIDPENITSVLTNFDKVIGYEWLETNGIGGWAGSTIPGCNTRRYHGLLVAATDPPAVRMNLLSKMDETICCGQERYELGTNDYGDVISPQGNQYLCSFTRDLFPEWEYAAAGIRLKKTVAMVQGENTTLLIYEVLRAPESFTLELLPLFAMRGYHELMHANDAVNRNAVFEKDILSIAAYTGAPAVFLKIQGAAFQYLPDWYYHFYYSQEASRGLDCREDLFTYGKFSLELKQGDSFAVMISTCDLSVREGHALFQKEISRKKKIIGNAPVANTLSKLKLAGDQFIVTRGAGLKTVIAGYHWFTDWGRDTMISLPGLCLSTGRWEDAKGILEVFSKYVSMGMLPNRFPDQGTEPEYNNADATLWFFIAIDKYLDKTGQTEFVLEMLLPVLTSIIEWHFKGTRYQIHVTAEGLLYAGAPGQQLTWMDARVGGKVITPRMGYPVEIQALWYNALKIYAKLLQLQGNPDKAAEAASQAEKTKRSFINRFWYAEKNYLYDTIDEKEQPDPSLRPNQLFAISLPYALLEGDKAAAVLKIVSEKLLTPVGLRSLSGDDPAYIGVYTGNQEQRDGAYHQGTVWAWLLGPYLEAVRKVSNDSARIRKILDESCSQLQEACLGSISEIFDGDPPHYPRGCVAQAWSVAELLRIKIDYASGTSRDIKDQKPLC